MVDLSYEKVADYWSRARPSILGPYMMDGFGFPAQAGDFRFQAESKIVDRLIRRSRSAGVALDLGSGVGYWAEFFAQRFAKVIAVERS